MRILLNLTNQIHQVSPLTTNTRQDSNFLNSETSTKKHRNNEMKQINHMNHLEENLSIYKIGENGNGNITLAFFNKPAT